MHSLQMSGSASVRRVRPESYLNMEQVLSAALVSGAQAVHPGFGFLSENTKFARMCQQCGIDFIGSVTGEY